ncbi:hypothetical protein [Roseomonas mucosa]|uniref:hypothetical protein n=1 Tax=Roseomonas mucosa TaxID=207340 RepID=UPI00123925DC|nr:hypothetical protein [Roseomonas mucosa]MBS5905185.1 hypothetical protein [Acetobacteraceae bacterium]MDT8312680.1 hypothetical protein [Roseomonas mucosa]MDT8351232.1 hypothetical protein [Roseomonas mucosa]MDT8360167.1 hypothetical protein [Roseomonas mucosa]QET92895.1 hypothetical protein FOB66_08715 [Roseomonas mucosa]
MADGRPLGAPLRVARLETKRKRVHKLPGFDQSIKARKLTDAQILQLVGIEDAIVNGRPIAGFYRASTGRDELLLRHGVMHLHLDHSGSNVLLYLMQFSEHVLLLSVGGHGLVDSRPPGANLPTLFIKTWIEKTFPAWVASQTAKRRRGDQEGGSG